MSTWAYFVLGIIAYQILKMLYLILDRSVSTHREKKVLKLVRVHFPDNSKISFITVDSSDKRAMKKMIDAIKKQYDVTEGEIEGLFEEDPIGNVTRPKPITPDPGQRQS